MEEYPAVDVSAVPKQHASWSRKLTFVLAAVGSVVGLGTIWRFLYLTVHHGGGTFIAVFLGLMLTLGATLLVLEAALGRYTRSSVIKAFTSFRRHWRPAGVFIAIIPFVISAYYYVVGGWVTHYISAYGAGQSAQLAGEGASSNAFIADSPQSVAFVLVFATITFTTTALGVDDGVERVNLIMVSVLIVISFLIAIYILARPGALAGLQYFFVSDWSEFSAGLLIAVLGRTFSRLSVAAAVMVTYGSYMKEGVSVTSSSLQTMLTILRISLLAGLMVIPATFVALGLADAAAKNSGPSLMLLVLPQVFVKLDVAGSVLGFVFFLLVVFTTLTSMISLMESDVTILQGTLGQTRRKSLLIVVILIALAGSMATLGYSSLSFTQPLGKGTTLLNFLDLLTSLVMMPLAVLVTCLLVGWIWRPDVLVDEVRESSHFRLCRAWVAMLQYVTPVLVVLVLVTSLSKAFGVISF